MAGFFSLLPELNGLLKQLDDMDVEEYALKYRS
jgi:hypothetical protein